MEKITMEKLIPQTVHEIDKRIPDALRLAFGIPHRVTPPPAPGQHDEVAALAAALLPPRDAAAGSDPTECDDFDVEAGRRGDLKMVAQASYLPDHAEDAYFMLADSGVLGVADGVGGYRSEGVEASAFARALMRNAILDVTTAAPAPPGAHICPRRMLERAYRKAVAARTPAASTAVILALAGRTLRWAYIGDSGFAVFRDGRVVVRSQAQQYHFGCPFQLGAERNSTDVSFAAVGEVQVMEGDVVVAGTDGLLDNVSDEEMGRIVEMGAAMEFSPKNVAELIAGFAYEAARCSDRDTPYSVQSRKERGTTFTGGKPDDITVVVAFIV
ncbi:hypothetical protein PR202_ga02082 [Eleusine coracana subsp. coracana]|uniref:Protein phosphatase n=1 Tax=Eleusine coracana subsp. coracana TaxID=191504 RepID=A0AAV5BJ49_ELECO|nr:hypothetical protein QOZ80_2AG0138410 [Eleusine coracana subsp. coracana]GJM85614.1 hypothetical protein PR202_ga01395 [Eleusine coracana subsp. coracana]GJM86241.1 hypothetical protein PR202_ga02082 [Eleusine coracana subsp. coracana]